MTEETFRTIVEEVWKQGSREISDRLIRKGDVSEEIEGTILSKVPAINLKICAYVPMQ